MIKTALLIDCNDVDNFINHMTLKSYGVETITTFKDTEPALAYLLQTKLSYELILIDAYFQQMDGFEFVNQFNALSLHKTQGRICFLSALLSPRDMMELYQENIPFIQKPLSIESLEKIQLICRQKGSGGTGS